MPKHSNILSLFRGDRTIWIVLVILSLTSLLIVYSATGSLAWRQAGGQTWYYLVKQLVMLGVGFTIMLFQVNYIPVRLYSKFAPLALLAAMGFVGLSLFVGFTGGATGRTLSLGVVSFQPSELAKIVLIVYVARVLANNQNSREHLYKAFLQIMIVSVIVCGMIFFADFSTSVLLFGTILIMLFVGRIPLKYIGAVILVSAVLLTMVYFLAPMLPKDIGRVQTMRARIERFVSGEGEVKKGGMTQAEYAKLAIYKGGLLGKGPGDSEVSNYMAAAYNDFIFAIFIEEYGMVGGIFIVLLYLTFLYRGGIIVRRSTRTFPAFLVVGLVILLVSQAMINMGVAVGIFPVTGQPLPWVSMGGTSMIFTAGAFGCILSVSYQTQKNKQVVPELESIVDEVPNEDENFNDE